MQVKRITADKKGRLSCPVRNHAIITRAEQAFPTTDSERQDALEFMVFRLVRPVHQAREQAEAAGVVSGSAQTRLHKGTRNGIHFSESGIGEAFLCGERVGGKRYAQRSETEGIAGVKKVVCAPRRLELDESGRRREQRVNRI